MSHKEKISFGEFDNQSTAYIGELVHEMLVEKGINPSSYSFSIEVEYAEEAHDEDCPARVYSAESANRWKERQQEREAHDDDE